MYSGIKDRTMKIPTRSMPDNVTNFAVVLDPESSDPTFAMLESVALVKVPPDWDGQDIKSIMDDKNTKKLDDILTLNQLDF